MKRILMLSIFVSIFLLQLFSQSSEVIDLRRSFLIYTEGDSSIGSLLEQYLKNDLEEQGKYKVLSKDDLLLENLREMLENEDYMKKNLDADFLVHIQILESFPNLEKTEELIWWEYRILAKVNVVKISTGENIYSKLLTSSGTSYINASTSDFEAIYYSRRSAANNLASSIATELNKLFKIRANIVAKENKYVHIDAGRNVGIREGMMFEFVITKELNGEFYDLHGGKLIAEEVWDNNSLLKILEAPKNFNYRDENVYVLENPTLSPIKTITRIYYVNEGFEKNGVGFEAGFDNYEHLYTGFSFVFLFDENTFDGDFDFKLGYLNYLSETDATLLLGILVGVKSVTASDDASAVYFKLSPVIDYSYYINETSGLYIEAGYNFLFPIEEVGNIETTNDFKISAGFTFRF
ncbi:hypothetical protein HWHPT5561_08510 [Petrotoga sp. HWH.PT.55.6.1]|uniref:hypothetical protein n=1 Tax=unclassified Petrotoga TaxID=2620614 RepID=UPI000CA0073B|nr:MULTISPECIES: hypothetical protein [unclassified Petrotoga]PNR94416.1 hypothetical protein X926_00285 [Petrotoga sp. HWHPT.55.6.3]RPD35362.1 hypothetical protein HWHPT5561_08510 [Petrotoga sp. HWH.PT.55.6.1]